MLLTTTDLVPGREITATLGLVRGSSIRSRHVLLDFLEWLHNLVGGELRHYTKMMAESREQAPAPLHSHILSPPWLPPIGIGWVTGSVPA